jgi:hypothetical protein
MRPLLRIAIALLTATGVAPAHAEQPYSITTSDGKTRISIDMTAAPDLKDWSEQKLAPVLAQWYPRIESMLASKGFVAPRSISITLRPQPGVAETSGAEVSGNSEWFKKQLDGEATGAMVHELVHVVQQYGDEEPESVPGWLTEGIADYIRFFKFEPNYHGADDIWLRKQDYAKIRFDGAYRQSANFLNWVSEKYDPTIVPTLNMLARQKKYSAAIWKRRTGKTVDELGEEWKAAKRPAP